MMRVRTGFTGIQGSPWLSTMYFQGDTQTEANAAVVAVKAFWDACRVWLDNEVVYATEPEVPVLNTTTGEITGVFNTTSLTNTGNVAGVMLPPAAQGLIRWRTGHFEAGREVRGRTFIPGITQTGVTGNGLLNGGAVTAFNAAAAALIADANSVLAVWSRAHAISVGVVTGSTWTSFASLRSRRD